MNEKPILFSGPMVRAILAGRKTQTRRVVLDSRLPTVFPPGEPERVPEWYFDKCPYGKPGDRLWVREAWSPAEPGPIREGIAISYREDFAADAHGYDGEKSPQGRYRSWKPSIHMPRWASRLTLEIADVRVERLQAIGEDGAKAEGIAVDSSGAVIRSPVDIANWGPAVKEFSRLWDSMNGERAPWYLNPWVWVLTFKVCN